MTAKITDGMTPEIKQAIYAELKAEFEASQPDSEQAGIDFAIAEAKRRNAGTSNSNPAPGIKL